LTLSFSLKFILDQNFGLLFWKLLVSEFLLGVFAIVLCSVSAPPVKIVPPQDVHRLLMLSAVMIMCSYLGTFSSVAFCKTLDFILLYYYYYYYYYYTFISSSSSSSSSYCYYYISYYSCTYLIRSFDLTHYYCIIIIIIIIALLHYYYYYYYYYSCTYTVLCL
jgi:hypothetical protein